MANIVPKRGIEFSEAALSLSGNMSFQKWLETGKSLTTMRKSIPFWYGDFLNYGESKFGEKYAQAFDPEGDEYKFVQTAKWVSKRIPPSRRHPKLGWQYHFEVADLADEEQDELLAKAEKEKLPVSKFRKIVYQQTLALDLPEKTPEEIAIAQVPDPDFASIQKVVDTGLLFLEALQGITVSSLKEGPRDFLLSHLRDVVKVVGEKIITYEKQTADSA